MESFVGFTILLGLSAASLSPWGGTGCCGMRGLSDLLGDKGML